MVPSWQLEVKMKANKCFWNRKMNLRSATMKYVRLVVFMRQESAEIWGFRYGLILVICTLKVIASTGVFVRVVCALKHSIENFLSQPSTIVT
jgi:hypothetical protein